MENIQKEKISIDSLHLWWKQLYETGFVHGSSAEMTKPFLTLQIEENVLIFMGSTTRIKKREKCKSRLKSLINRFYPGNSQV